MILLHLHIGGVALRGPASPAEDCSETREITYHTALG